MNHSRNISFEYVFHFLFRTSVDNLKEPQRLGFEPDKRNVSAQGFRFEEDKRLFRRDVKRGEPLEKWGEHLRQSWLDICQVYAEAFGDEELARQYCQLALQGVALLVLEDGDSLGQHVVTVPVKDKGISELKIFQVFDSEELFRIHIAGFNKRATCYRLDAITSEDMPYSENLQLLLDEEQLPCLAPLIDSQAAPNSAFLVCGLTFGGVQPEEWQKKVESVLVGRGLSNRPSLLATVFTRLMMEKWQFMRIDKAADKIRALLQERNAYYMDYAHESDEMRPHCASTRLLERQLQDMHSLNTQARFAISRIQGALQTLDINGDNLAKRLEGIRQEIGGVNGKLSVHSGDKAQAVDWNLSSHEKMPPLLAFFSLSIRRLQDHRVYLQQEAKYLEALRDKWLLYLDKRKTQMGEYLNTWGTILVFLFLGGTGTAVTLNVRKGFLGLPFAHETILFILFALSVPILWYFMKWVAKLFCCILYGTWLSRLLCHPILRRVQSVEFFSWFKKR